MITASTLWAASAVLLSLAIAIAGATVFVVKLIVASEVSSVKSQFSVAVARLEGKIDGINLAAVTAEIMALRDWRHDFGPKKMVYDACVDDMSVLQKKFDEHCLVAERKISDLSNLERRIHAMEQKRERV